MKQKIHWILHCVQDDTHKKSPRRSEEFFNTVLNRVWRSRNKCGMTFHYVSKKRPVLTGRGCESEAKTSVLFA